MKIDHIRYVLQFSTVVANFTHRYTQLLCRHAIDSFCSGQLGKLFTACKIVHSVYHVPDNFKTWQLEVVHSGEMTIPEKLQYQSSVRIPSDKAFSIKYFVHDTESPLTHNPYPPAKPPRNLLVFGGERL